MTKIHGALFQLIKIVKSFLKIEVKGMISNNRKI
jgi:hypothetical protein